MESDDITNDAVYKITCTSAIKKIFHSTQMDSDTLDTRNYDDRNTYTAGKQDVLNAQKSHNDQVTLFKKMPELLIA